MLGTRDCSESIMNAAVEDELDSIMKEEEMLNSRKTKPGIVYLSSIPDGMNPQLIREFLSVHGEIGKTFLQPMGRTKSRRSNRFVEGWVEFKKKKVAKMVAERLNNTKVGGKKRSSYHECLWNIKYLPRFKWAHLNERLAYEKAVHQQRMRTEIAQVKRETNFYIEAIDKSKKLQRKIGKLPVGWNVTQRNTEEDILLRKPQQQEDRGEFFKKLFKSS